MDAGPTLRDVFLRAAERLHGARTCGLSREGACWAVRTAARGAGADLLCAAGETLSYYFEDDAIRAGVWTGHWGRNFADDPLAWYGYQIGNKRRADRARRQAREGRVLMLLFLAEIAGDNSAGEVLP